MPRPCPSPKSTRSASPSSTLERYEQLAIRETVFDTVSSATTQMTNIKNALGATPTTPKVGDDVASTSATGSGGAPVRHEDLRPPRPEVAIIIWTRKDSSITVAPAREKRLAGGGRPEECRGGEGTDLAAAGGVRSGPAATWPRHHASGVGASADRDLGRDESARGCRERRRVGDAEHGRFGFCLRRLRPQPRHAHGGADGSSQVREPARMPPAGHRPSPAPRPTRAGSPARICPWEGLRQPASTTTSSCRAFTADDGLQARLDGEAASRECEDPLERTAIAWSSRLGG